MSENQLGLLGLVMLTLGPAIFGIAAYGIGLGTTGAVIGAVTGFFVFMWFGQRIEESEQQRRRDAWEREAEKNNN